jgi:hypothetical protein
VAFTLTPLANSTHGCRWNVSDDDGGGADVTFSNATMLAAMASGPLRDAWNRSYVDTLTARQTIVEALEFDWSMRQTSAAECLIVAGILLDQASRPILRLVSPAAQNTGTYYLTILFRHSTPR